MSFSPYQSGVQRGLDKACKLCKKEFGVFKPQHQCKRCLRAVCSVCAGDKKDVFKQGRIKQPHRLCKNCVEQVSSIQEYIKLNRLVFGEMSEPGKKWLKKIKNLPATKPPSKKQKISREAFETLWDSYSHSFREFIGLLTFQLQNIYPKVEPVCTAVMSTYPEEMVEDVIYVVMFFLCFASPEKAASLALFLLELKMHVINKQALAREYLQALNITETPPRLEEFLNRFSLNEVAIQSSIYVVTRIIQRNKIQELFFFYAALIDANKAEIQKHKDDPPLCALTLLRNCKIDTIGSKNKLLTSIKVTQYIRAQLPQDQPSENMVENRVEDRVENRAKKEEVSSVSEKKLISLQKEQWSTDSMSKPQNQENESFTDDSFSMISMIEEEEFLGELGNLSREKSDVEEVFKKKVPCGKCDSYEKECKTLSVSLHEKNLIIASLEQELAESRAREGHQDSAATLQRYEEKVATLSSRIKELENVNAVNTKQMGELRRILRKQEEETAGKSKELQEINLSLEMMRNKLENRRMGEGGAGGAQIEEQTRKMNEMLKNSLMEKNSQLQAVMKKNKLMSYQLEESNHTADLDKLKAEKEGVLRENQSLMSKMKTLSELLMQEQSDKLAYSQENFELKQILKEHHIALL